MIHWKNVVQLKTFSFKIAAEGHYQLTTGIYINRDSRIYPTYVPSYHNDLVVSKHLHNSLLIYGEA